MKKSNRRKASKHEDEDMADLISNLPDHILLLILSGLPSTEEIIRTSILSRRWRYLWTSVPSLDLVYPGGWKHSRISNYSKFKEFVDWVLLNRCADLDSFRVSISPGYSISTIEPWIHATFMRNVKQLDLSCPSQSKSEDMVMPHCASLEVLSLCCINRRLIFPSSSGFPSLRVLKLKFVELLDSDSVKDFLESCLLLEDLTLDACRLDKLDRLCISCPNLKKLKMSKADVRDCIKIYCPKLVFMELTAVATTNFIVERLHSLKEARIDFMLKDIPGLFPGFFHVESLTTHLFILYECIEGARYPALPKLKTLELTTTDDCSAFTFLKFVQILKHCPELESLCLIVRGAYADGPVDPDWRDLGRLEVAETPSVLPYDVKWVESIEINGERPQLDIDWYPEVGEWAVVIATWGNRSIFGFEPQPNDLYI